MCIVTTYNILLYISTVAVSLKKITLVAACTLDLSRSILEEAGIVLQGKMIGVLPGIVSKMEKRNKLHFNFPPPDLWVPSRGLSFKFLECHATSCLSPSFHAISLSFIFFCSFPRPSWASSVIVLYGTRHPYSCSVALITIIINYLIISFFSLLDCEIIQGRDQVIPVTPQAPNLLHV